MIELALFLLLASPPQSPPEAAVARVLTDPRFDAAVSALERDHDRFVSEIVTLTEIPAPPFREEARANAYLAMLRAVGLSDVERDTEGNVMGVRRGRGDGAMIAIASHLDTVFPAGTDVRVRRNGTRLSAPGIGDNTRSLAALLSLVRAMNTAAIHTDADILFVGNVGEEGTGDLRGIKYLFQNGRYRDRIGMFIALDGTGDGTDITHGAVGSRRYRVVFRGPGGHSYNGYGTVNPAFALGRAMTLLAGLPLPTTPRTTLNVGTIGGGTAVNAIPSEVWFELDLRSESQAELVRLEERARAVIRKAADDENAARSTAAGTVSVDFVAMGDRPSGEMAIASPLVQTAAAVVRATGREPNFSRSSTDANLPISLGIPAIAIDSGGLGGRAHALDEWIDVEKTSSVQGLRTTLALVLALAGMP